MKKTRGIVVTFLCSLWLLSGCGVKSYGLAVGELDQVAEYAAKMVLKHTKGYQPNLMDKIEVKEETSKEKEMFPALQAEEEVEKKTEEKENSADILDEEEKSKSSEEKKDPSREGQEDLRPMASSLSSLYGSDTVKVLYGGSGIYKKYPKNEGYFSLIASEGMKLFVVRFFIENITKKETRFVQDNAITYRLFDQSGNGYKPNLTLLENDMKSLDVSIAPGQKIEGVVIFNIPKKTEAKDLKLKILGKEAEYHIVVSE